MTKSWVPHDVRDEVVDFVRRWSEKTEISVGRFPQWLGIGASKFYDWRQRYGRVNEHNGWIPRDFWLEPWEKEAIIGFHLKNPLEGYRRLTFMMLDAGVVAVSPASVWRVLKQAGLLSRWKSKPSRKGTGFEQPPQPHQHWHIDVSYINLSGTFYYLCSVLDGYSRSIVHWDLRESMKEAEIEMILERAKEKYPEAKPRIISDNGPQFIARDFKEFIRISGMTHVRTSPFYPQSNGKLERWHKSLKSECIRPLTPLTLEDARRLIQSYVDHYNRVRLHSAIGYVTPQDMLAGRQAENGLQRAGPGGVVVLRLLGGRVARGAELVAHEVEHHRAVRGLDREHVEKRRLEPEKLALLRLDAQLHEVAERIRLHLQQRRKGHRLRDLAELDLFHARSPPSDLYRRAAFRTTTKRPGPPLLRGGAVSPSDLPRTRHYLSSTVAPASMSFFFISSACAFGTPSFTAFGAASTRSLASFKPRPVSSRTTLMTLILFPPAFARNTVKSVFSSAAAPAAGAAWPAAAAGAAAAAFTPNFSSASFTNSAASRTVS